MWSIDGRIFAFWYRSFMFTVDDFRRAKRSIYFAGRILGEYCENFVDECTRTVGNWLL